ncbi:MAG: 50S ribosomal protein L29 [Puniceicoccales bacterium]|jgi:ribosomal protein L29|nr:50S ribosomal protein L29 [Puniceicoccales bacterium]
MANFKELDLKELREKAFHARAELLDLRLKKRLGSAGKPHVVRHLRKEIARLETFMRMKRDTA